MGTPDLVSYMSKALLLVLWLSLPPIIVASIAGVLVSLLQALTQIQEQTLSFAVKLVTVSITIFLTARWVGGEIYNYTVSLFAAFPLLVK
jgi:type III secretion protein S